MGRTDAKQMFVLIRKCADGMLNEEKYASVKSIIICVRKDKK